LGREAIEKAWKNSTEVVEYEVDEYSDIYLPVYSPQVKLRYGAGNGKGRSFVPKSALVFSLKVVTAGVFATFLFVCS
jgi:hypothetical protein